MNFKTMPLAITTGPTSDPTSCDMLAPTGVQMDRSTGGATTDDMLAPTIVGMMCVK